MTLTVTYNLQTIDISDLKIEQVGVDSDDDLESRQYWTSILASFESES